MVFLAFAPSSVEDRVPRVIFPLPCGPACKDAKLPHLSRVVRRRVNKSLHTDADCVYTARALNACFSGSGKLLDFQSEMDMHNASLYSKSSSNQSYHASAAQTQVLHHIERSVRALGPPPAPEILSSAGAFAELCGATTGYDSAPKSSHPASYDPGLLSIPGKDNVPIPLASLWDHSQQVSTSDNVISSFSNCKVLPAAIAAQNLSDVGISKCYSDPLLHVPSNYGKFWKLLFEAHCISFSCCNDGIEFVEAFFVLKKNGKLRMVIDARRSNCHFAKPSHSHLCTGEALGRIEIEPREKLFIASSDLKDAFYHIEMPDNWQRYFAMRPIKAKHVGISSLNGRPISPNCMLFPRLRVIPMGWSCATF